MLHKEILLDIPEIAKTKLPFLQKNTTIFQSYCQEYDYVSGSDFKVLISFLVPPVITH